MENKPKLSFKAIWAMSLGFLGVQYAFGLQQANMSPIYRYLGAEESTIPFLWLAGPVSGLLVQPIIGVLSDRTWSDKWGRRRPYILVGAIMTSIALILMPNSTMLWHAAALLWILDAFANGTMEPFRALITDKLNKEQRSLGYAVQSLFVGLGQILANLMPFILGALGLIYGANGSLDAIPLFVKLSFYVGAGTLMITVLISVFSTKEYAPTQEAIEVIKKAKESPFYHEIWEAFKEMPTTMKQLWWVKFFTWYSLPLMWQYYSLTVARVGFDASSPSMPGFDEGIKYGNLGFSVFSGACLLFSLLLPKLANTLGNRKTHAFCLSIGGIGFILMQFVDTALSLVGMMTFVGIAWSSIMSMPYVMLSGAIPKHRIGVYMGLFNSFIVIPQILSMLTVPLFYNSILLGDPRNALLLAGIFLLVAAFLNRYINKDAELK
ncbi:MAG: MFS transporter [Cyclobacteriaceae bacterium]|nr:MFS transporter [Cyclobacteriaceae bacterium]MCH8516719.1 MFS transporter [Cyclobacteriaceae bacterium]